MGYQFTQLTRKRFLLPERWETRRERRDFGAMGEVEQRLS